jgi:hypothetical protein
MAEVGDPFALYEKLREEQQDEVGKFEGGEHLWLGMAGARAACATLGLAPELLSKLKRRKGDVALSYGEIVALSGDFYPSPAALYEEKRSPLPWLWERNDLSDLRKIFQNELAWIEGEHRAAAVNYPDNNIALWWNAKSYVELALDNTDHFGWHNIVAYCRYHTAAIELAVKAASFDDELFRRALYYNAFADHFLTDGFAAGHIRVPRAEISAWGKSKARGYSAKLSGGLSKLLHDQDGHVSSFHAAGEVPGADEGLPVRNSLGRDWCTRCDGQLFIVPVGDDPLIAEPVAAVAESLVELFTAQRTRQPVVGEYAAIRHVPFPRPGSPRLQEKFSTAWSAKQVEALVKTVRWYVKVPWIGTGLTAEHVVALFNALPELMAGFAAHVRTAHEQSPELRERLPQAYVKAFSELG